MILTKSQLAVISQKDFDALLANAIHTNGDYYFGVVAPVEMLGIRVPSGAKWGTVIDEHAVYDDDGGLIKEAVTRQKTMDEFLMTKWVADPYVLARLCAMQSPVKRLPRMTPEDVADWIIPMNAVGIPPSGWIVGYSDLCATRDGMIKEDA